jgi:hypothetical protein
MATLYALNLNFDPGATTGLFLPYNSTNNTGRAWFQSTDNGLNWTFAGNPDNYNPTLDMNDSVQFAVSASPSPSSEFTNVVLTVLFANDRAAVNSPVKIASPFQQGNGYPQCVLNDTTRKYIPPPPNPPITWYLIGPYTPAVNTNNPGSGQLKFEFSIAAVVTLSDGAVKQYGYDPEMDVDVN